MTGGAGLIGSNLVHRLLQTGADVTVVDNLWRGSLENLQFKDVPFDVETKFFNRDLREPGILETLPGKFDFIVHLADVVAGVDYVFSHQGDIFRNNILINTNVVASARMMKPQGYLYVGTACSFPQDLQTGPEARPLKEEDQYPADPESAYGWSKLMGEYEALLMEKELSIPVSILVLHNVYGTPCDLGPRSQVIPSLLKKAALYPSKPFVVWGSGNQGRAFVHVDDVVDALVAALEKGWGHGAIQIGPGDCTTIRQIAETAVAISGKTIEIQYDTSKPEGDKGRRADSSKAQRLLGWQPKVSLNVGLAKSYQWISERIANPVTQ
ncbi:GDP-mannose 4,6-dehydratase [soil metagenome]